MQLTPTEEDRLRVFTAAQLARATLERGLPLNAPEAVALVCDEMHAAGRGGGSFDEVAAAGPAPPPPPSGRTRCWMASPRSCPRSASRS
jgi:urease subunit gamma/beta